MKDGIVWIKYIVDTCTSFYVWKSASVVLLPLPVLINWCKVQCIFIQVVILSWRGMVKISSTLHDILAQEIGHNKPSAILLWRVQIRKIHKRNCGIIF